MPKIITFLYCIFIVKIFNVIKTAYFFCLQNNLLNGTGKNLPPVQFLISDLSWKEGLCHLLLLANGFLFFSFSICPFLHE